MDDATTALPPAQQARLRTDVFLTFGGKAATLVLGLAMATVIARQLGASGQGIFAVAYSLSLLLTQVGGLGITAANPYFVARESPSLPRIVGNSIWLAVVLGVVLAAAGAALKLAAPGAIPGLGWTPLLITLAAVPGALAALFLQSILLGEGRMMAYNTVEVVQTAASLTAIVAGFVFLDMRIAGVLAVLAAGRYAGACAYFALLKVHGPILRLPDLQLVRRMLAYGFRVYLALLMSLLVIRLDLLLVNSFLGSTEAGLYSVAATLADGMFVLPMVVGLNLFPRVARGNPIEATAEVFRSIAVLYGIVCLATIPVAGLAIQTFFGDEFKGATSLYYWLLPGIYSLGMLTILSQHFVGRGFPPQAVRIWFIGLALNVVLNLAFLPGRGAWVAALTSSVTYALLLLLFMWLFAREAGGFGAMRPSPGEVVRFVRVALSRG